MTDENEENGIGDGWIEYEVTSDVFDVPDDHIDVGEGRFRGPPSDDMDEWAEMGLIEVVGGDETLQSGGGFSGTPELVRRDGGEYVIAVPGDGGDIIRGVSLAEWVCQRCGHDIDLGPVYSDGDMAEPEECPSCERGGPFVHAAVDAGADEEKVEPLLTTDPIWEVPTGVGDADFGDVWDRVREYIRTHWDAGADEWLYDGLTAYAISSWFRPDFEFVPHILVMGAHNTGKTRLLNTLKEVCYRAVHTASTSTASVYRAIDNSNVTFFLSEYHDISDEVQQVVDAVLKMGQKRGEVALRAEEQRGGGYDVAEFSPFTHVAISTQFEPRDDISSRCFNITTQPASRSVPWRIEDADDLRADLLGLRYEYLGSAAMREAQERVEEQLLDEGVSGREGEKMWGLLTVADLAGRDLSEFVNNIHERDRQKKLDTEEAYFVQCVIDEAFDQLADVDPHVGNPWPDLCLKLSNIRDRFCRMTDRDVETRYVGTLRKRTGLEKHRREDGVYIRDHELKERLQTLADQYGLEFKPSEGIGPDTREYAETTQSERVQAIKDEINTSHGVNSVPIDPLVGDLVAAGFEEDRVRNTIDNLVEKGVLIEEGGKVQLNE